MRHAFASRMIARGIFSTVLAKLKGHESSAITERRLHSPFRLTLRGRLTSAPISGRQVLGSKTGIEPEIV
jgi:hypothetical protein